jgi:hypothetical protein
MSNFYQGLLFLHGHIADTAHRRRRAEAPRRPSRKPAAARKPKRETRKEHLRHDAARGPELRSRRSWISSRACCFSKATSVRSSPTGSPSIFGTAVAAQKMFAER